MSTCLKTGLVYKRPYANHRSFFNFMPHLPKHYQDMHDYNTEHLSLMYPMPKHENVIEINKI